MAKVPAVLFSSLSPVSSSSRPQKRTDANSAPTASFRTQLSQSNIQFDFIDGPFESAPAAGVDLFYPPPYYGFWENHTLEDLRSACGWLSEYLAKKGPYDAVMGFSQGTILASSYLLLHQEETPHLPPPFKIAIFHCGAVSLLLLEELGFHISPEMRQRDEMSRQALSTQADSMAILNQGSDRWKGDSLTGGLSEEGLRNEITGPIRISIPTVHIYGSKDPRYSASLQLAGICDPDKRRSYNHGGGHEIPRRTAVSTAIAELLEWAMEMAAESD